MQEPASPPPARPTRVLSVDDDPVIGLAVEATLQRDHVEVETVTDAAQAMASILRDPPDLVILDVGLPGMDGFSLLRQIRRMGDLPVILLTARDDEIDRIVGLELGADDYVVKPFSPRELSARVRNVLRRSRAAAAHTGPPVIIERRRTPRTDHTAAKRLEFDGLSIDPERREVVVATQPLALARKEFDLLVFLASSPRRVFSRDQILTGAWGSSADWQDPATVTEHVRRLRSKLEADPDHPRWIETVRGVGYRFVP